jgi:hypothetical protein
MPIIEIYRVRIDPANVARLLEIRGAAMAELRKQLPELWQADLVRLDHDAWLDIQTWNKAVDPACIGKAAQGTAIIAEMHGLITAQLGHDRGERAHTTGTAWAAGR